MSRLLAPDDRARRAGGAVPMPGCRVVLPGDTGYDTARRSWNHLFSHRPAGIAYVRSTQDVIDAVAWAESCGLPLRVRGGGHSHEGRSTVDDGLVIDTSELASISIDVTTRTVTVGAGVSQSAVVTALAAAGFAAPTGTEGSVGLAGAALGGGVGLLTRAYGLACDALLSAEIVVATGDGRGVEAITVDADHHADLLWALRGAGNGSFGVVTRLTFAMHPLSTVVSVTATWWGLGALPEVFDAWQQTASLSDERLSSQLQIDRDSIVLFAVVASSDEVEALRMLAPLLATGSPDTVAAAEPWAQTFSGLQMPPAEELANWSSRPQFVTEPLPAAAIDIIRTFLAAAPTAGCTYSASALGGAVARSEPRGGAAFAHREALFCGEPRAGWGVRGGVATGRDAVSPLSLGWVADFAAALGPYTNGGGADRRRLGAVKQMYDPYDLFPAHYDQ